MTEKYLKKCSTSLVIRELQIKTILRFHLPPIRMVRKKKTQIIVDAGRDVKKKKNSSIVGGIACWYNYSGNQSGGFSEN